MQSHNYLIKRLVEAARIGEDIWPILQAERDHLTDCPTCQAKIARLMRDLLGEKIFPAMLIRLESLGQLEEPRSYPRFDLSFLQPAPTSSVWRSLGQVRELAEEVKLRVRVHKREMEASFEGLSGWLLSSVTSARAPVLAQVRRGERVGKGQVLSLPDPEGNLKITLAIQAAGQRRSHLSLEIRETETDRPIEQAQVSLHYPGGGEVKPTKAGKATFIELDPDQYTIEIRPTEGEKDNQVWRFTITLEAT